MLTIFRVVAEAKRQFDLYTTGKGHIDPNLRGVIFGIVKNLFTCPISRAPFLTSWEDGTSSRLPPGSLLPNEICC